MSEKMLSGKRILITQADAFMGPCLCEVFADLGADVIGDVSDLTDPEAPARAVAAAGDIHVLVANLAIEAPITPAVEVTETEWREVFAALVDPLPRLFRAVLPRMIARRSGKILVMGSSSALRGMKRASTYSAARGAQIAYVQAVGVEVAPHNVQVKHHRPELRRQPDLFPARDPGQSPLPGAAETGGPPGTPGDGQRGCGVRRVSVQRRGKLLRRPGLPRMRRLGGPLEARGTAARFKEKQGHEIHQDARGGQRLRLCERFRGAPDRPGGGGPKGLGPPFRHRVRRADLILPSAVADVRMQMFNADGSESEMCGNGIRCVAKYAYDHGLVAKREIAVETGAGS